MEEVFIYDEALERLNRLEKRLNMLDSDIVAAALKFYEDALDAVENARNNPTSMSFEVMSNE